MLCLRNRLLPLLRAASPGLHSPIHSSACRLLTTSTSTATVPEPFSLDDYLVAACGFAPAQAREVSKKAFKELSKESKRPLDEFSNHRLVSASNPDAILALLSDAGLSRADIAAVVSADPLLLRASANNIAPRLVALRDRLGLSTPQIARFLLVGSRALREGDVIPKLELLISFYGSFEQVLVVAQRCDGLVKVSPEKVKLNIALLYQWGVRDVVRLCTDSARLLTYRPERLKEFLLRAEELGVPAGSPMFSQAVAIVSCISKEKVAAKLEFFKRTLGCSESEVSVAVSKMPRILGFSHVTLLRKIEFLVNEAKMEPQYIVQRPILLAYSLEKRLGPRHNVMKVLQGKRLLNSNTNFFTIIVLGEEAFKSKFIDCHRDSVPGLADAYAAARAEFTFKWERVKEFLLRAEELGVPAGSQMFSQAVAIVSRISKEKVAAKLEFFKRTLGCSESEVSVAVSKMPRILGFSHVTLLRKIEFLVNEAKMEPQYIVQRPILLAYSLEKRLVPRHNVMKVLQGKRLLNSSTNLFTIIVLGEEAFKLKFIDCHRDSVPSLADAYAAARAGIVPSRV